MWFHVLACDYDGTLATAGAMAPETTAALRRVRESGRRVLLLTGRRLDDLPRDRLLRPGGGRERRRALRACREEGGCARPGVERGLPHHQRAGAGGARGARDRGPHVLDVAPGGRLHHLGNGDITGWLRGQIKDAGLADEVEALAQGRDAAGTRRSVLEAIARRYAPVARADEERRSD